MTKTIKAHGNQQIIVSFDYDGDLVDRVKGIKPKGKWNRYEKYWEFPLWAAAELLEEFEEEFDIYPEIKELATKADELRPEEAPEYYIEKSGSSLHLHSPYDPALVRKIKRIVPKGKWNSGEKVWEFPWEAAEALIEELGDDFAINEMITQELKEQKAKEAQQQEKANQDTIALIERAELNEPLPNGWNFYDHQKAGIEWLIIHRQHSLFRGGILADDMGLGKTIMLLKAAQVMKDRYDCNILVVCPASLKFNWLKEADFLGVEIEVFSWAKMPKPQEQDYILIGDEAHAMQNPKSQRSRKAIALSQSQHCLAVWLATATPLKNGRPSNVYPLLKAIAHPLSADKREFDIRYCKGQTRTIRDNTFWDNSGASNLDELSKLTENAILRRMKDQCLDLPPKIRSFRPIDLSSSEAKEYKLEIKAEVADFRARVEKGEVDGNAEALVRLGVMRQIGSRYKIPHTIDLAQDFLQKDQSVVIFCEFRDTVEKLHEALGGETLTGETPTPERQAAVDRFQAGESKVFIGTVKAGGVGITLTASSVVILHDRPYTPGDAFQAEDRCYRIGAKEKVLAVWMQVGEIDQAIDSLLQQKQDRIELVLKGKRKTFRGIKSSQELAKKLMEIL